MLSHRFRFCPLVLGLLCFFTAAFSASAQTEPLGAILDRVARPADGSIVGISPEGALLRAVSTSAGFSQRRAADSPRALYAIGAAGATVIAAGDSGYFLRSTDSGVTFPANLAPATTPAFVGKIQAVAKGAGANWAAVGTGVANQVTPLFSIDDGFTWTKASSVPTLSGELRSVVWTGARWLAVGGTGSGGVGGTGYILSSTDGGNTWTSVLLPTLTNPLYFVGGIVPTINAVASDGANQVLVVGDGGLILTSADGGLTFSDLNSGVDTSDRLNVALYDSTGSRFVVGGDNGLLLTTTGSGSPTVLQSDNPTAGSIFALTLNGSAILTSLNQHGPISLTQTVVGANLQLSLQGAVSGNPYFLQSSTNLTTWAVVPASTQTFGGSPLTWTYALPSAGQRIFYRALLGAPELP